LNKIVKSVRKFDVIDELKNYYRGLIIGTFAESQYYLWKVSNFIFSSNFWVCQLFAIPDPNDIGNPPKCQ